MVRAPIFHPEFWGQLRSSMIEERADPQTVSLEDEEVLED